MVEFTSGELTAWVMLFFWPFVRILAFVAVMPLFSQTSMPRTSKIGIAAMLALLIAPTLKTIPDVSPVSYTGFWLLVQQVLIGSSIALVMRVIFAAIQAAGDFIGLQMGLGFASFYSAAMGTNAMVLGRFLNLFAVLFFLAFNAHLLMLHILAQTFVILPISPTPINPVGWQMLAQYGSTVFTAGVALALPLIATLLTINLALGILNRASPQLTIFTIGFPLTLLSGLVVMWFLTPDFEGIFTRMFSDGLDTMRRMAAAMAGPIP